MILRDTIDGADCPNNGEILTGAGTAAFISVIFFDVVLLWRSVIRI